MAHGHLVNAEAGAARAHQDLGVDEGADRRDRDRLEYVSAQNLERAVDVAHAQVEELTHECAPDRGQHAPSPRITARLAVARDDVELAGVVKQRCELFEIELQVGVAEEDELASRFAEPGSERGAVAAVRRVAKQTHVVVTLSVPRGPHAVSGDRRTVVSDFRDARLSKTSPGRAAALTVRSAAERGRRLDRALAEEAGRLEARERAFMHELTYGVTRMRGRLDHLIAPHVRRGLESVDSTVLELLRLGAYQLLYMGGVPDYAAVSETVDQVRAKVGSKPAGFVNAVLRKVEAAGDGVERFPSETAAPGDFLASCHRG